MSGSWFLGVLVYPGLVVVEELGSDGVRVYWLLLLMVLHLPADIWLILVLTGLDVSLWSLVPLSLCFCSSLGRPMSMALADLLGGIQRVGSVALGKAVLIGVLQTVGSSECQTHYWSTLSLWMHQISCEAFTLCVLMPWVEQISCEAFRLWGLQRDRQTDDLHRWKEQARKEVELECRGIGPVSAGIHRNPSYWGCLMGSLKSCLGAADLLWGPQTVGVFTEAVKLMICPCWRHRLEGNE